jgi:hypothetical protein
LTEPEGGALATPEATRDDSSRSGARQRPGTGGIPDRIRASGRLGWLVLGLGLASAALLFAAELATLSYRTIGIGACGSRVDPAVCETSGGDAHSYALWAIAVFVVVFAVGATVGRSRPAALALMFFGAVVLAIAVALDLPDLGSLRGLDASYTQVRAHTGAGFWFEIAGGVLALLAGLAGLRLGSGGPPPAREAKKEPDPVDPDAAREERRRRREAARS